MSTLGQKRKSRADEALVSWPTNCEKAELFMIPDNQRLAVGEQVSMPKSA
jgi:hypothetical protein